MKPILRDTLRAILLTTAMGLFGCDGGTESAHSSAPSAADALVPNAAESITVDRAWIRATAPGQTVSGAFMTLENKSATAYALSGVSFSGADVVEIHETSMADGVMRMRQVDQIDIPANGSAELKPGSYHVMLIGLDKELQAGTTESLTLTFSDDSQITIEALVGGARE